MKKRSIYIKIVIISVLVILGLTVYKSKSFEYKAISKISWKSNKATLTDCEGCSELKGILINYSFEGLPLKGDDGLGMSISYGNGFVLNSNNQIFEDSSLLLVKHNQVTLFDLTVILPQIESTAGNFPFFNRQKRNFVCPYMLKLSSGNQERLEDRMLLQEFEMIGNVNVDAEININGFMTSDDSQEAIRKVLIRECLNSITDKMKEVLLKTTVNNS